MLMLCVVVGGFIVRFAGALLMNNVTTHPALKENIIDPFKIVVGAVKALLCA